MMEFKLKHEDNFAIAVLQDLSGTIPSGRASERLINTKIWQDTLLPFFRRADKFGSDFAVRGEASYAYVRLVVDVFHEGVETLAVRLYASPADGEWRLSDEATFKAKADDFIASASFTNRFVKAMDEFAKAFGEESAS